jgi:hypothetical protein
MAPTTPVAAAPVAGVHGAPSVWPTAKSSATIDAARSQNVGVDVLISGLIAQPLLDRRLPPPP